MTTTEIIYNVIIPTVLAALGGSSLLTWYLQTKFAHKLELAKIANEAAIRHEYETKIESLRSELSQQSFRASKVFETTEKTIAQLYRLMLPVLGAAEDYTVLMQSKTLEEKNEQLGEFSRLGKEFYNFFHPNKIYIPKRTAKLITDLMNNTIVVVEQYNMTEKLGTIKPLTPEGQAALNRIEDRLETLKQNTTPLLRAVESDFQRIFGLPADKPESINPDGVIKGVA